MARILTAGFETGSVGELNGVSNANVDVVSTYKRSGAYSLRLWDLSSYRTHVFSDNYPELWFRFALRLGEMKANANVLSVYDFTGAVHVRLRFTYGTQTLDWVDSNDNVLGYGFITLHLNVWYLIQCRIKIGAAGELACKINGVTDAVYSGQTAGSANESIRSIRFSGPSGILTGELYIDDIAVNDSSGGVQDSYPGLGGVLLLLPDGEGDMQTWTPRSGSVHWSEVDNVPAGTAAWVESSDVGGELELFNVQDTPEYVSSVDVVNVVYQAAVAQSGYQAVEDVVRQGTVDYPGGGTVTVVSISPTWVLYQGVNHYVQPNGSGAWDRAALDVVQIGLITR